MIKGTLLILLSALSFALSTLFAKLITTGSHILPIEITFFRFSTGFTLLSVYIISKRKSFRPNNFRLITLRSLFNTSAVIFFFLGVQNTTITKTNLLNMTYPVFVFFLSPFLNREKVSLRNFLYLVVAMAGIYLVIIPNHDISKISSINRGDLYSLLSGILAGLCHLIPKGDQEA